MTGADTWRCSDAARDRGDPLLATAPPARRLLLVEVPGPWGQAGLATTRLPREVSSRLAATADVAGVRVQLIRSTGRHAVRRTPGAVDGSGHAWALADAEAGVVRWGSWRRPADLLEIDLHEPLAPEVHARTGPQRLALVCTHAKRDVCCAVRGRPVAAAVAAAGLGRDTWETSHLGGDRFAANLLLLPEGEVFGGLDPESAVEAARRLDAGRLTFGSYRGRVGRPPVEQAAMHLAAVALDDDRVGAVRVTGVPRQTGEGWEVSVVHGGVTHRMSLAESWAEPERLTCSALASSPARRFTVRSMVDESGVCRAG